MGSEHYCLRWNNHQSNLLGVFSQLLRDESLVDVTLACSEGHSIRAHKVVLSACSSYFQTLFVDHPSRHPIVILKDVHFAELRTLIEFMYKGEVNVEYCQLPTLLKTAESLKVKGLAEMTNQGTLRQDYKQEQPDEEPEQTEPTELVNKAARQPPPQQSQSQPPSAGTTTNLPGTATTSASSSSSSEDRDREMRGERDRERDNRERERDNRDRDRDRDREKDREKEQQREQRRAAEREHHREHTVAAPPPTPPPPKQICHTPPERPTTPERTRSADTPLMLMNEDCRPSDMTLHNNGNAIGGSASSGGGGGGGACSTTIGTPTGCNRLTSPILSEPLPGPSNMPPVQQVPLSLKKEVDWGGGGGGGGGGLGDDKSTGESSSDYPRHSHDPDLECRGEAGSPRIYSCMYCGTTFQHQSKLTRHILSHSLESLKYREPQHHLALGALAAESPLNLIDFSGATRGPPGLLQHEPPDPSDAHASPMDLELAAAAAGDGPGVVLCKFCGKSFPDVSSLITHLPVHTGDRPFKCEFCGKAFKLRHHMKDHCRVHTGERPFRCTLCGKTFSRSTILKAHEKTHYPKYVRKFLSPSPLDTEEESPH